MAKVPLQVSDHCVPGESETRLTRSSASKPSKVRRPCMVWVPVLSKVRVRSVASLVESVFEKLLKVVEPEMDWFVPSKTTVPDCWVKVPAAAFDQLPARLTW